MFETYPASGIIDIDPFEWLIPDEIPRKSLALLVGAPGVGKSFLALDYASRCAVNGRVSIGKHVRSGGETLYIAAEGVSGYASRIQAWQKHHKISSLEEIQFLPRSVSFLDPLSFARLMETVKTFAIGGSLDFVIVDTLARCMAGGDENSAKDMGLFIQGCDQIREATGATVLVVHHMNRSGSYRGSSALPGACDVVIEMTKMDDKITVSCGKMKDAAPFSARYLQLVPVKGTDSCVLTPFEAKGKATSIQAADLTETQRTILNVFQEAADAEDGLTATQIVAITEMEERTVWRALATLKERGIVRQDGRGTPYSLV